MQLLHWGLDGCEAEKLQCFSQPVDDHGWLHFTEVKPSPCVNISTDSILAHSHYRQEVPWYSLQMHSIAHSFMAPWLQ